MRASDTQALLDAWEAGHTQDPQRWALTALAAAEPQADREALARLSIGQRDARLLGWRCTLFGSRLGVVERCPACGVEVEVDVDADDIRFPALADVGGDHALQVDDWTVRFRLPDSFDLIAATQASDVDLAESILLDRCVIAATCGAVDRAASDLPDRIVDALSDRMAALDPQADVRLRLHCAACAHSWAVVFDILQFVWRELDATAARLLRQVHRIATGYGWSESHILAMTPARRLRYLAMLDG